MAPNNSKEIVNWTRVMDDALIKAFMVEYNEGSKLIGSFTTQAYDNIVKYLSALFGKHIDKDKVKNWWKTMKKNFSDLHDIFKHLSGFAWNLATQIWEAEPEVWDALIEAKPKAALWRNTPIPNYEKMMLLYGVDRANGEEGETMREWRKKRRSTTEVTETINNIDNLVSQGGFSLSNVDMFVEVDGQRNSLEQRVSLEEDYLPHANSVSSKKLKRAPKEHENNFKEMIRVMSTMVASLDKGNTAIMQANSILQRACNNKREVPQLSSEELCKMLQDCGCDVTKILKIFCFLMNDDDKLKTAVQSPTSIKKEVIMEMFYGSE